jgi:hypothetical protein
MSFDACLGFVDENPAAPGAEGPAVAEIYSLLA